MSQNVKLEGTMGTLSLLHLGRGTLNYLYVRVGCFKGCWLIGDGLIAIFLGLGWIKKSGYGSWESLPFIHLSS